MADTTITLAVPVEHNGKVYSEVVVPEHIRTRHLEVFDHKKSMVENVEAVVASVCKIPFAVVRDLVVVDSAAITEAIVTRAGVMDFLERRGLSMDSLM